VLAVDYTTIARLEADAFGEEEFSQVAFGPRRFDWDVLEARGREMGKVRGEKGVVQRFVFFVSFFPFALV